MKRILIVDDELLVRIGIKSMLEWEEKGYTIVGEAVNGQDAIEKIAELAPQIVLTDLVMEPVNGLELIRYCAERHPDVKIVVLSNYTDFEKVKAAMKLGARDFLFKLTIRPAELLDILDGISREIDRHRLCEKDAELLLSRNAGAIRQRLIRMMLAASYDSEADLLRELRMVDVRCDFARPYALLCLAVANFGLLEPSDDGSGPGLLAVSLENIVGELTETEFHSQTFRHEDGKCLVVINLEAGTLDPALLTQVREVFERIDGAARRYFGVRVMGALSREHVGVKGLAAAAAECRQAMQKCFLMKDNRLLVCSHERPPAKPGEPPVVPPVSEWTLALEHFQFEEAERFLERAAVDLHAHEGAEPRLIRERLHELYRIMRDDGLAKGIDVERLVDERGRSLYQAITQDDLLSGIFESFRAVLHRYRAESDKIGGKKLKKEIARIVAHVNANPGEKLSVAAASDMIHMSESYFSHLFKSEMGVGFVDYVNRVRIEKAKELLIHSDLRVNEIAAAVGIENPNYFSILFRKTTSTSPVDFRNRHIAEKR